MINFVTKLYPYKFYHKKLTNWHSGTLDLQQNNVILNHDAVIGPSYIIWAIQLTSRTKLVHFVIEGGSK